MKFNIQYNNIENYLFLKFSILIVHANANSSINGNKYVEEEKLKMYRKNVKKAKTELYNCLQKNKINDSVSSTSFLMFS